MSDLENQLQEVINEGAYDLTDPKHPTFAKRYQDYLKANNTKHSSVALRGFLDNGGKPTAHGTANEEYENQLDETTKEYDQEVGNPIIEMIDSLMSGELAESNALFYDLLAYKINEKVELKKIEVAQGIFGESKDEDEDEDDNKSDEVGEDEENKHPLVQLNKIASSEEGIPLKYPETTASGEPDKRSIRAATDRIKSGKSTSGIPTFKHKNGEESVIHPDHAKHLSDILSGSTLKPDTKKAVLDHIHGSKAGLEKVSGVLLNAKPNEKSAYGSKDARTA